FTRHTLLTVLETALRALHPVIPFITEEIWQALPVRSSPSAKNHPASLPDSLESTIMECRYPQADEIDADPHAEADVEWLKAVLTGVRRIRAEMNIAPGKPIALLLADGDAEDRR